MKKVHTNEHDATLQNNMQVKLIFTIKCCLFNV